MKKQTKQTKEPNPHAEHRERVRARFKETQFDGWAPHEVLEFLLFYGIPQKDTNEIAHDLINKFGSFSNVFDAPLESIFEVKNMTMNSSILIKALPLIANMYRNGKLEEKVDISNIGNCVAFLQNLLMDSATEQFYLLSANAAGKLINCTRLETGSSNKINVNIRKLQEQALADRAVNLVIAHNHPAATPSPSDDDIRTTQTVIASSLFLDMNLYDHIIISGKEYFSFRQNGLLNQLKKVSPQFYLSKFAEESKE